VSIIARYLLAEFLIGSSFVFLALFVTYVAAYSVTHLDMLGDESGRGGWEILFRSLELTPVGVPIACLAGAVWSLTRAVRNREITAIRCGGIPLQRVLLPILGTCLLIGAGLAVFEDRVIIPSRTALAEAGDPESEPENLPTYTNGRWWYAKGTSIFSAKEYLPDANKLIDVTVFKLSRDRQIEQRIEADEAVNLSAHSWEFHGARIFDFGSGQALAVRQTPHLKLDLGVSAVDLTRAGKPVEQTTLRRLIKRIRHHKGLNGARIDLVAALHIRLARPLAVLVLVLLALPFAIGDVESPDSLPRALVRALATCLLFWIAWGLAVVSGRSGFVPPALPLWGMPLLFIGVGAWRFRQIRE
jgi:lipopolysaccharide export system permease protein